PPRHRLTCRDIRAGLRYFPRDSTAPLHVFTKPAPEPLVVRQPGFFGCLDEDLDESLTLRFGDRTIRVVAQQRAVSTQLTCVRIGPAEHLAQPGGEMLHVSRPALTTEDRDQNRVCEAAAVLHFGQASKRGSASEVLEDRRLPPYALPRPPEEGLFLP